MEWQPIETAPKDGSRIIVFRPRFDGDYIPKVGEDYWMRTASGHHGWGRSRLDCQPTHWMPMPSPPTNT